MLNRQLSFCLVALLLALTGTVQASLDPSQSHESNLVAIHRRLGMPVFDVFSPQGQAQRMLHCLGEGPSQHANTDKVVNWMQANPPSDPNVDPNAIFSLNPQDWGFHGFRKRSGHSMDNWKREGKPAGLQKRLQTYRDKLVRCNDRLKSDVNAANNRNGVRPKAVDQTGTASKAAPQTGTGQSGASSKDSTEGSTDPKPAPQQDSTDPKQAPQQGRADPEQAPKQDSADKQTPKQDSADPEQAPKQDSADKQAPKQDSADKQAPKQDSTDPKQAPQQGNSASKAGSTTPSPDGKPKAPGLGDQQSGVTPVMDPGQKLLPQPGGKTPSTMPAAASKVSEPASNTSTLATGSPGCSQIIDRPEYGTLSVDQKTAFISAVMCVRDKPSRYKEDGMNAFDDWVLLHIQMLKYVHFTAYFLVFHRAMLAVVEKDLRDCGMPFGLPWVDWTKYAADGSQAPIFDSDPKYGFGSNGQGTADKCPYGSGKQVTDGAFADITFNAPFKHSLCREFNNMDVQQPNPHWGNNCTTFLTDRFNAGLQTAHNEGKFFDFASALEISSHTAVHTCLGGNMPWLSSSANDLTFYVHHGFVDRQFTVWQSQSASNKNAFQGPKKQTKNGARPPWDATADDVMNLKPLAANVKVSDVLDTQSGKMNGLMCYRYTS